MTADRLPLQEELRRRSARIDELEREDRAADDALPPDQQDIKETNP